MSNTMVTGSVKVSKFRNGYRARTRYKAPTGIKDVQVLGRTASEARERLLLRLDELTPKESLRHVAEDWLTALPSLDLSVNSQRVYATICRKHVLECDASLTDIDKVTPGLLSELLHDIGVEHGAGAAKTAKTVLSNIFTWAARYDRVKHNPVRSIAFSPTSILRARGEEGTSARAFTVDEYAHVLHELSVDTVAIRQQLYAPCLLMGTLGVRIGEALSARMSNANLKDRTMHVKGTKTAGSDRILSIPPKLHAYLSELEPDSPDALICPSRNGTERDVSNTCRMLRSFFDRHGYPWATSHTFRKTVATRMDEAGFTAREIADQLGHSKISMTQDRYLGRGAGPARLRDMDL